MDKEDLIVEMIKELKEDNKEIRDELKEIKDNHLQHIYDKFDGIYDRFEEQSNDIHELKGSFSVIKPIGYTIAVGVVLAVVKYLFFH